MSLLGILLLSAIMFCLFLTGLFVNAYLSMKQMSKQMDAWMNAGANGTFSASFQSLTSMVNRGWVKLAIHLVCGLGTVFSAIVALVCIFLYVASMAGV